MPVDAGNTLGTARDIIVNQSQQSFTDSVSPLDNNDYYRFTFGSRSNLVLSVNGMTADADVQLLDLNGSYITHSANAGASSDAIVTDVAENVSPTTPDRAY